MTARKSLSVCEKGHEYYKSSDCPTCPECDIENRTDFLSKLSSPARNALIHEGIDTLKKLSAYTEKEILKIHGIGPASLPMMRSLLEEVGLSFK
ncbi:MAG: RNA polymerase alpha subunit C-terminal domain-containing protein [Clostridiaceae bacterium]